MLRTDRRSHTHRPSRPGRMPPLTTQIFIGLVLGIIVGYVWPAFGVAIRPLADAFLRMIKMIIAPLLFSTLVVGIAGTGDLKAMGRIGVKAIVYFEAATTVALFLGLALVNIFKPGAGMAMPAAGDTSAIAAIAQNQQRPWDIFLHLFPTSVVDAMARGDILQLVVFSTFFGIAVAAVGVKGRPVLEVLERLGVPKNIVSFVLPTGYSFKLDGTTLYLSLASVFVAQMAGVEMTLRQQIVMMLTLMLTSKGVAGVPRAALVVLTATLTQFGLPLEGAAILLGIDQVMDMGRTSVNVMGNCIATAVVARWEGVFDDERMQKFTIEKAA